MKDSKKMWDEVAKHPLQSWGWGEFREKMGNKVSRITGDHQYQIIWSKLYFLPLWFGYIPMGPVPTEKDIKILRNEGIRNKAIGIRIEPLAKSEETKIPEGLVKGRQVFKKKTFWIDLTKSDDELLAAMHPKGRYNIKVAQKHQVEIREENTEQGLEMFLQLMFDNTAKRQGFYAHNKEYFRQMWQTLSPLGMETIFTARVDGTTVSAWIVYKWKEFVYYVYGANSLEHRETMAPTLLMWNLIKWGKDKGCKWLDLWGTEEGKGFGRFKEQFGGKMIELVGSYDLPVNQFIYSLFRISEEVRWKILRALK